MCFLFKWYLQYLVFVTQLIILSLTFFFFKSLVYLLLTLGLHALYIEARTERVQLLL